MDIDVTNIIIALLAFAGTTIGTIAGSKLTAYRIEQLEKKVDKHNAFAERIPVIETKVEDLTRRVDDIEEIIREERQ